MFLNYLKLAVRLLLRNPFFTFINVAGLSVGFAAFCILWPYSQSELKSDRFHKDYEQIAKLSRNVVSIENGIHVNVNLPVHNSGIARQFKRDYPEIIAMTGIIPQQFFEAYRQGFDRDVFVSVENKNGMREFFREQTLAYADSNFFQFFSFPLLIGNPETVLRDPKTAVISAHHAEKYFGKQDPVDKTIFFNDSIPVTVKGVFKDFPKNTHMKADVIISTAGINELNSTRWEKNWFGHYYIKVTRGADFKELENKINSEKERIYGNCPRCSFSVTSVYIQPLKTIAFTNLIANTFVVKSEYLLIVLSVLAFVIPLLAWINYISLSIHMLKKRTSEMAVRKVVGAARRHFMMQFAIEAVILNLFALLVSLTLVQLTKGPAEKWLTFYTVSWHELPFSTAWVIIVLLLTGIIVTSAYPILISFSNKSMLVIKKNWSYRSPRWINIIVTAQYSIAVVLLILIICVYLQLNLILSKPIGIDKNGVITIDCPLQQGNNFMTKLDYFVTTATTIDGIEAATISKNVAGDWTGYGVPLQRNKNGIEFGLDVNGGVDESFLTVFGIKLLHGRNFQKDMPADRNAILLSHYATKRLGFSTAEEALGTRVILPWYGHDNVEVIGVYQDYEFQPFLLSYNKGPRGSFLSYGNSLMPDYFPSKISIRTNYEELNSSLRQLEFLFEETFPHDVFRWTFVDENVQKHYITEKVARNQIGVFTLIAIGIACLGLLGLIFNKVVEKTKEIGIRKVLGAGLYHIVQILLNTTMQQVAIATVISIPLAYYLAKLYLEKFSERIELQWWHFVLPVALLIFIMGSIVGTVVWKAAKNNPVDALKCE